MMSREKIISGIQEEKIISIIRGANKNNIADIIHSLYDGGIRYAEITFDQSGTVSDDETAAMISAACEKSAGKMSIGAGTVVSEKQTELAKDAGAEFIISPNTDSAVIKRTVGLGMVSIPGAFTPSEIIAAHSFGADFVKLFPMVSMDISYIKAIMAPINNVKLLAVGGVNSENMHEYFKLGICGLGVGSDIVSKKLLEDKAYAEIKRNALKYTEALKRI